MDNDPPAESGLSFEDFLSGKREERVGEITPPAAQDDPARAKIAANIRAELTRQLRSEPVTVLPAGMKVRVRGNAGEFEYVPDLIVDAETPAEAAPLAKEPQVIFEIAAADSERAKFIASWQMHTLLPSLGAYVVVDSDLPSVTVYRRKGGDWSEETLRDADEQIFLSNIHALLSLETVYKDVWPEAEDDGNVTRS